MVLVPLRVRPPVTVRTSFTLGLVEVPGFQTFVAPPARVRLPEKVTVGPPAKLVLRLRGEPADTVKLPLTVPAPAKICPVFRVKPPMTWLTSKIAPPAAVIVGGLVEAPDWSARVPALMVVLPERPTTPKD